MTGTLHLNLAMATGKTFHYQVNLQKSSRKLIKCLGKPIIVKLCLLESMIKNGLCYGLTHLAVIFKFHSLSEDLSVLNKILCCNPF